MRLLVIAGILLSSVAVAHTQTKEETRALLQELFETECEQLSIVASESAKWNQAGHSLSDVLLGLREHKVGELPRKITVDAYDLPRVSGALADKVVQDYRDQVHVDCLKGRFRDYGVIPPRERGF